MKFEIKSRFSKRVLFTAETESMKLCVEAAVKARAYLARANLTGADLTGADLTDAYLARANLTGAYLADADLTGANLADANLTGANLTDAYLADANLTGANLADANLADANLARAKNIPTGIFATDPPEPYECKPSAERRAERAARYRALHPEVPVVEALDAKMLQVIESGAGTLNMGTWHTCETTHCRAGWAVKLAGEAGDVLEQKYGPEQAGAMIYRASTGHVPYFYATNEAALDDIRKRAAQQAVAA
jgi:hypothetical protein